MLCVMRPADKLNLRLTITQNHDSQRIVQYGDAFQVRGFIGRWATSLGFVFGKSIPLLYVTVLERY